METKRCLYCLQSLDDSLDDFHPKCSKAFFGTTNPPDLPYTLDDLHDLAKDIVHHSIAVPGVQPKLSLAFEKNVRAGTSRLTLVGLWGHFILKPPNSQYPELVENEHATMQLAQMFGIGTVPFSLIRLQSGELSYLTRRIDRTKSGKLAMEDFCQLSERLTEYKYRGSVEQIAKLIRRFSSNPGLDAVRFFEVVLFCFLTGNADMHLKNYSLLTESDGTIRLAPAYDLVATKLALPQDPEESALTINGKKNRLTLTDFQAFAAASGLPEKAVKNVLRKFEKALPRVGVSLRESFLSKALRADFQKLLEGRAGRLGWNSTL